MVPFLVTASQSSFVMPILSCVARSCEESPLLASEYFPSLAYKKVSLTASAGDRLPARATTRIRTTTKRTPTPARARAILGLNLFLRPTPGTFFSSPPTGGGIWVAWDVVMRLPGTIRGCLQTGQVVRF